MLRMRYAQVPVVPRVRGLALGGGCEFALYGAHARRAMESYIGLVEAGVGLLPAGGGLKEIARACGRSRAAARAPTYSRSCSSRSRLPRWPRCRHSALESRALGYLRDTDVIVFHKDELLTWRWRRPSAWPIRLPRRRYKRRIPVAGRNGIATIKMMLVNMRDGGFISAHDFQLASLIADVVCGGDVDAARW